VQRVFSGAASEIKQAFAGLEESVQAPPDGISLQAAYGGVRPQLVIARRDRVEGGSCRVRTSFRHLKSPLQVKSPRFGRTLRQVGAEGLSRYEGSTDDQPFLRRSEPQFEWPVEKGVSDPPLERFSRESKKRKERLGTGMTLSTVEAVV